jgi:uncharacterized protein
MTVKIEEIKKFIQENMGYEFEAHNFQHAFRVLNNAEKIMNSEKNMNLNELVIKTSCLVHDYVDVKLFNNLDDQQEKLIRKLKYLEYKEEDINDIIYIINNISYSKGLVPKSIEGKIVQDADRLDAILAFGILRPFTFGAKRDRPAYDAEISSLSHYIEKKLVLEGLLNTDAAKKIAKEKGKISYLYLAYLLDELPDDIYEKQAYKKELGKFYTDYSDIIPDELIPAQYKKVR